MDKSIIHSHRDSPFDHRGYDIDRIRFNSLTYDPKGDAVYLELLKSEPEGVIEVAEGIHIDVTSDGKMRDCTLFCEAKWGAVPVFSKPKTF